MRNRAHPASIFLNRLRAPVALGLAVLAATFSPGFSGWQDAHAQVTDIATLPVFSSTPPTVEVKPNVMFILDDSGSMEWTHMPDQADDFAGRYGFASSHCNGIYYNPNTTYTPPVDAAGTSYPNQVFTAAAVDGYGLISGTVDLSVSFRAAVSSRVQKTITSDATEAAYYYVYTGTQTTEKLKNYYDVNTTFYKECVSSIGSTPGSGVFTKKVVSSTSGPGGTDERTNFANWYSYYRFRLNMMKTATGLAFKSLDDKFRVGLMTLNTNTSTSFLNIADFTATQKTSFYTGLYNSTPNNGTPLRAALASAGRMYAGKLSTYKSENSTRTFTVTDPVQYSCQQNYTILSTDGMWNGGAGVQLDGSTLVGNADGGLARPYNDGSKVTTTTVTPYTSTQDRTTTINAGTLSRTWSRTSTVVGAACSTLTPPSDTASAPMDVREGTTTRDAALYQQASDPDGSEDRCEQLASGAWMCRSGQSDALPAGGQQTATDASGVTWYLVSRSSALPSSCKSAKGFWGNGFFDSRGACPGTGVTGNRVTVTPQTQTESVSSYQKVVTDRYLATQTTTQVITEGVPGSVGALTPTTPAYNIDTGTPQVSSESAGSRTCGGVSVAYPGTCEASGTWTNGTPTTNNVCTASTTLPTAGFSSAVPGTAVTTGYTEITATPTQLTTQVAGTATSTSVGTDGVSNTLADVSAYYYNTPLRTTALGNCTGPVIAPSTTANDLCASNVPANDPDTATYQHMTTYTLGLGVRGRMVFSPSYLDDKSGDFFDVLKGSTPTATDCTWRDTLTVAGVKCNWPVPGSDKVENTDDLWHAAVNGRGNYFSATDPGSLASGLTSTLKAIVNVPKPGTASAAATTNPKITSTNNFQFSSYFKTVEWSGELIRQTMNLTNGSVPYYDPFKPDPATYDWSAQTLLDAKTYTTRNIYTKSGTALVAFTWANLDATQKAYFKAPHISTTPPQYPNVLTGLSQFCSSGANCLNATNQTAAEGEALVNFLRGDRSNEEVTAKTPDNAKFYRYRKSVLGDIVSAQPQYVGAPSRFYSDSGYAAYKTLQASRTPIVYTAANDGMLHAFNADTGAEAWAYVPSFVLPRMYTLADKAYADKHQYFVEGTPIAGDICPKAPTLTCADTEWKTILVGGLNAGGTGYYALDVTDPASPKLLWEFSHAAMGFSFGKPQITKLDNGQWVVLLTSGYNDCPRGTGAQANCALNGTGDGQGRLYVLDAGTGAQLTGSPIATGAGSDTNPSGLGQVVAQADSNNVTKRVYAGDLLGNVWRFKLLETATPPTTAGANFSVHKLATLMDGATPAKPQPITVRPQVTTINGYPVVYVGTGRYLGATDVGTSVQNSFYGIKDDLTITTTYNSPRTYTTFIGQSATDTTCPSGTDVSICKPGQVVRTVTQVTGAASDSLTNMNGWYVDFPAGSNEIAFTDPKLTLGTLAFSTSVPKAPTSETCTSKTGASDGDALAYMLDYLTGGAVGTTSNVIATNIGAGVATAPQIAQLPNGTVIAKFRLSTGQEVSAPLRFNASGGATRRVSWRELVSE
ncbi:MAG: PilC/PilY family type IV pilus protein [Hylemonella sp.]|nr:PilC/PilY family type IV pilus protein [Hylemonella sp.]